MSKIMKAAVLTAPGGPEALQIEAVPVPVIESGSHVLVRLKAASLNPADSYFRAYGPYLDNKGTSILGHDGAGVVEQVGSDVTRVSPGDRVCFCNGGIGGPIGTYAEFAVVPETQLAKIPDSVDFASAAALPLVFITAWESLCDRARVEAGESVLIHAGAGGTGHIALGARVATTVSSDAKAELVSSLGAERPIRYRDEDFVSAAMDWTEKRGLDVAFDNLGPEIFKKTIAAMAPYGRMVTLMGTPGDDDDETAYVNNLSIHNVMMLTPMLLGMQARLDQQARLIEHGLASMHKGEIRIVIAASYALVDISAAHQQLDAGGTSGKIVLRIGDQDDV